MFLDILKLVIALIGGGLGGAVLNQVVTRRSNRLQKIPLIERVNRLVTPNLKGFTLARVAGDRANRRLEEIANVREYQMTLRNTSAIHLKDIEVQFEFPTEDVEGWASRPALSKTALLVKSASPSEPWKKAFRWQIPHLPGTDSVEFSFNAIDPPSDQFEVALYNSERVVAEISKGEPAERLATERSWQFPVRLAAVLGVGMFLAVGLEMFFPDAGSGDQSAIINRDGCFLVVTTSFRRIGEKPTLFSRSENTSWEITNTIHNLGTEKCAVQPPGQQPAFIEPGKSAVSETFSVTEPELFQEDVTFGADKPTNKERVSFYRGNHVMLPPG